MRKGSHHSLEARAKISIARIGVHFSEETLAKMRAAHANVSPETRTKLRIANRGHSNYVRTKETRAKQSIGHLGEKAYNWKGGINRSGGYECIRIHSHFYIKVHRQNMERILGRKLGKSEVVHHINGDRLDNGPQNLALCSNESAHGWCRTEEARIFFG